jgi:hypothetical protein
VHIHLIIAKIGFCHEKFFLTFEVNLLFCSEKDTFHENTLLTNHDCLKTNNKTNEIRRTLAVFLFTGISLSNELVLQATEGFFSFNIREILSVG